MMKPKLIMILEDDEHYAQDLIDMIISIKDAWGREKYEVLWAKNGEEGFKLIHKYRSFMNLSENKIKCIISDIKMPVMNGVQFITELRRREKSNILSLYIPVVFLTAYEDDEKWKAAVDNFVTDYLKKDNLSSIRIENTLKRILEDWDGETLVELTQEKGITKREAYAKEKKRNSSL